MREELNNFCTDLKEIFMQQNFEKLEQELESLTAADVLEMMQEEHGIIVGYYTQEKYDMLLSHLNFVAFCSYLFEYTAKRQLISQEEYEAGIQIYLSIYTMVQQRKG